MSKIIIGTLVAKPKDKVQGEISESIVGGYSNARGELSLIGESLAYRVNLSNKTVRQQAGLNAQARVRYEAAASGEAFHYCSAKFCRLSESQIVEICASGPFRVAPRHV